MKKIGVLFPTRSQTPRTKKKSNSFRRNSFFLLFRPSSVYIFTAKPRGSRTVSAEPFSPAKTNVDKITKIFLRFSTRQSSNFSLKRAMIHRLMRSLTSRTFFSAEKTKVFSFSLETHRRSKIEWRDEFSILF